MSGKEASRVTWKHTVSMMLIGGMMAVGVFAIRGLMGPDDSNAQAPVRTGRPVTRTQAASAAQQSVRTPSRPAAQRSQVVQTNATSRPTLQTLQTMAMVNGKPITRAHLEQACIVRFGEPVLESLVNKHLIWQACQKRGVKITEEDVNEEINRFANKFGISVDRWLDVLREEHGITPIKYRREIIWPQLALRRLAAAQIQVSPEDLKKAMESEYGPKVSVRMISVKDQAKAQKVHALAKQNPDKFGDLAKDYSDDPNSASSRGLIQPIRRHIGDKKVEDAAFQLKVGEISPIISVAGQFLILKCEKHIPESFVPSQNMAAVKQRLTDAIRDSKLRSAAHGIFAELQKEAKVVNIFNNPSLRAQQPNVAATINNQPITMEQLAMECLERHGMEVLEGEINRAILLQELGRLRIQVTQPSIDSEIARAADSFGYLRDGKPDVEGWLKAVTETEDVSRDIYIKDAVWPSVALKQLVRARVKVTDEDLKKAFDSNYGERVEVQAIVFSNARQAQQVWAQAKADNTEQAFGNLAFQYSIEPVSRANYGQVPPIRRHGGHQKLEDEAFRLKPGELSSIVATGDKYIILRCLGRTQPVEVTLRTVPRHCREQDSRRDGERI